MNIMKNKALLTKKHLKKDYMFFDVFENESFSMFGKNKLRISSLPIYLHSSFVDKNDKDYITTVCLSESNWKDYFLKNDDWYDNNYIAHRLHYRDRFDTFYLGKYRNLFYKIKLDFGKKLFDRFVIINSRTILLDYQPDMSERGVKLKDFEVVEYHVSEALASYLLQTSKHKEHKVLYKFIKHVEKQENKNNLQLNDYITQWLHEIKEEDTYFKITRHERIAKANGRTTWLDKMRG